MAPPTFDLQGHRGARGLKSENTLPSFEVAFDLGVSSVETDVHLTADGVPILFHDRVVSSRTCQVIPDSRAVDPASRPAISSLTLTQMRGYRADLNPDLLRFPDQDNQVTPLALKFAEREKIDPFTPPTLGELFAFAAAYVGDLGKETGKSEGQQSRASRIRFNLELKRVPFRPGVIGGIFDGRTAGLLEQRVLQVIREAGMIDRTRVRSFDHRCVRIMGELEPHVGRAVLIAGTAPISPTDLIRQAGADTYCPEFEFLDEWQVRQIHESGFRVAPWTVNDPEDWQKLLDWGVDGITTDYPDRLAAFLRKRNIPF
jgi:glycerophosphoryl diester phosphodiesterase